MTEEETTGVVDVASQQAEPAATEAVQEHAERQAPQQRRQRNDVEYNWAEARRRMQELERKNQEYEQELGRIKQQSQSKAEDDLSRLAEDDILTVKQAKALASQMAKNAAQELIRQREAETVNERLALKFPDFDAVVSQENIELLKETEPELAYSLSAIKDDPYAQGIAVYKTLKRLGIHQEAAPVPTIEQKKAQANLQKPMSVQAAPKQSALGNAHIFENGLTPDVKKQLWKDMQSAMKGF